MPFIQTEIEGVIIFEPNVFGDERGYFLETYNERIFKEGGIDANFVQDNMSYSKYGTLRGLHFQKGEHAQAKLVQALKGKVLDVAVDLRVNSPTFGKHVAVELSAENKRQLFVPRGFAHGFVVLSEDAIFAYKCDNFYNPQADSGVIFNDADLNIDWLVPEADMTLSEKDQNQQSFSFFCSKL